ncbi:Hypothetical protein POVR1_LOCUS103 [uncultured virus]|nr:Hypothetical protein POVR1_LOCUS103 [uncultured virus]
MCHDITKMIRGIEVGSGITAADIDAIYIGKGGVKGCVSELINLHEDGESGKGRLFLGSQIGDTITSIYTFDVSTKYDYCYRVTTSDKMEILSVCEKVEIGEIVIKKFLDIRLYPRHDFEYKENIIQLRGSRVKIKYVTLESR